MAIEQQSMLDVYLREYEQLKREQIQRIAFRDNLLYVTMGLYGVVLGFIWGEGTHPYALLVLPWVSLVLGWNYLINDQKISAIGYYIRCNLIRQIGEVSGTSNLTSIFHWEVAHRSDRRRIRRKVEQLAIDEIAFVVSGIVALVIFRQIVAPISWPVQLIIGIEFLCLAILGLEIFLQADWAKER